MKTLIFRNEKHHNGLKNNAPKRILIVEDDHALQTVLHRVIQSISNGALIDWVTSVEEANGRLKVGKAIGEWDYDLIIADIYLEGEATGIDFWQTCQFICPKTPILLMSSMPTHDFFKAIGRNTISPPFLPKPFELTECQQIIQGLFDYATEAA